MDDSRGLKIELVKSMNDFFEFTVVVVVAADVDVSRFFAVAVRVERVGPVVLVVGENAKILGPVAEGGCCVDEAVRFVRVVGLGRQGTLACRARLCWARLRDLGGAGRRLDCRRASAS